MRDISSTFLNQLFNDEAFIVVHRVHIAHCTESLLISYYSLSMVFSNTIVVVTSFCLSFVFSQLRG